MMSKLREVRVCFLAIFFLNFSPLLVADETLPPLKDDKSPQTFEEMWAGFDPRKEPLDVEVLKEWEEDSVVLKVLRYRIGVFKGQMAMMAAVYGYPKGRSKLPGLVQIHGGGQYADHKACLANAKRGYATISIAWAGRINAPDYRVTPNEVKLFWDGKTNDPKHKLTTDWGAVDGYHAPARNPGNVFPSAKTAAWTLDEVESPRNSGWFLCALASRRALTFLEQQPQVDASKLGVYGHSMGGKLTVLTTGSDDRVKAAAPSCGGISDRNNKSAIYRATLGDDVSLKKISCPIVFLSPSNDFHGLLGDLPKAIDEIAGNKWRVTCSPHHNHQDTPQYEVATMLWMDQHLKDSFLFPQTPETTLSLKTDDGVPIFCVQPDLSKAVLSVDVFYTQHGNAGDEPEDMQNAKHRFWHYAKAEETSSVWTAKLPLSNIEKPLWVYANVTYSLDEPVSGAGYYYRIYTAKSFNVSSLLQIATPNELMRARTRATLKPSLLIESFEGDWEKEWFTYRPDEWARSTHKIADEIYAACDEAALAVDVLAQQANTLVFVIDNYAAEIQLSGGNQWQAVVLRPQDFRDADGDALRSWKNIKRLKLTPAENLKLKRGSKVKSKVFGKAWTGAKPRFRNLRWQVEANSSKPKKKRPSAQKDAGKDSTENLAPLATLSGSGEDFGSAIDGIKQQDGKGEWIGGSPNAWYGWINYPKLELKWKTSRKINKVVLYDRPMAEEHMAACVLKFSDDSEVHVTAVPNDGSPKTVVFEPRTVTGMTMTVTDGIGTKIGLSEIEVYYDKSAKPESERKKKFTDFVSYVDPTIETGRGRWFFCTPGSRPFGMICASAYTRNKNQGGGGYNFNSTEVLGFAQIHAWIMSGINIMPTTGEVNANLGEKEWKSSFSHETETIEPGYHKLYLDRYKTQVEYTSTDRVAFYRLKYNEAARAKLLLQLGGFVGATSYVDGKAKVVSPTRIEGSHGMTDRLWGGPKLSYVHYVMELDRPILRMDGWKGAEEKLNNIQEFSNPIPAGRLKQDKRKFLFKNLPEEQAGVSLAYDVDLGDEVKVKIGISYTSIENARRNLERECPHWDFDRVRNESRREWNEWLGKIEVMGGQEKTRVKFYTDLWHVLLGRHKIDDLNGDYPSYMGQERIRTVPKGADGRPKFHMYNSDALWLTMWNLNVLWGLGWPEMLDEFSASMVQYAEAGGHLPRGPSAGGYTGIMCGCPATSLITATWQKGLLTKVEAEKAYQMMKISHPKLIHDRQPGHAVQGAFEYWALAQMAEEMGKDEDVRLYQKWIHSWKQFYDPKEKLLVGHWVEANNWQGTFGVSQDIKGLADLMGGPDELCKKLNYAFEQSGSSHFVYTYKAGYVSYANQPGCSNAHVFNHAGQPWLSQYWVRRVSRQAYGGTNPNIGYGGHDEDQGQMGGVSALMKLGLFSLRGTSSKDPIYEITAPEFDAITIKLDPHYYLGKEFKIKTHNNSVENCFIQKARLNGEPLNNCWFYHRDFAEGGLLELWLGPEPNKIWGKGPVQHTPQMQPTASANAN